MNARQIQGHVRAPADLAHNVDEAPGPMSKTIGLRKSQPGAFAGLLCGEERIEYFRKNVFGNAAARVGNLEGDKFALALRSEADVVAFQLPIGGRDNNVAALGHGIPGIEHEIDDRQLRSEEHTAAGPALMPAVE